MPKKYILGWYSYLPIYILACSSLSDVGQGQGSGNINLGRKCEVL